MLNQQIHEEACEWFVRMRSGEDDPVMRSEFMAWLRSSPDHVGAYLDAAGIWIASKDAAVDNHLDLATRIARARADHSVMELMPHSVREAQGGSASFRKWLAIAASVVLFVAAGLTTWWQVNVNTYATNVGEQRSIVLDDGSTVEMNSGSRIRVRFSDQSRTIELLRGQALFRVEKDRARPFLVRSDGTFVQAVGTVFDVYRKTSGAVVTVLEGTVVVARQATGSAPDMTSPGTGAARAGRINVEAGKQVVVASGAIAQPKKVNVSVATAWTQRQLVFEFTPLAAVVEEFNRYNTKQLVVDDEELRKFEISAIFRSTQPGALVRYLQTQPDVEIQESEDEIRIIRALH